MKLPKPKSLTNKFMTLIMPVKNKIRLIINNEIFIIIFPIFLESLKFILVPQNDKF
ncbi:MAG: hypothetical protein BAJALOKI2v1_110028 [Promethearchaeota archaeon]|nr:MAG: hypothetical protein BAJALOKI2v1_110028 [Candidatus Lokiarchaeota archaeon]